VALLALPWNGHAVEGGAMVSVNFDQGVEGGKGLKGEARRRG